ncbi:MAG: ParA family protein [Bacteroidales bacterium]
MTDGDEAQPAQAAPARPRVVTVFNQKGGVAKTTTAVNVAICLAAFGRRVALIDLDSQSNATTNLGQTAPVTVGAYHLITGRAAFDEALRPTRYDGLRLVAGSDEMAWADIELALGEQPEAGLNRALAQAPDDLDFIVVDCPPAPGIVSVNALVAADALIMPVMPSPHALDGLHKAWWNLNRVRKRYNQGLDAINILLTMTEDDGVAKRLSEDIIAEFGPRVMPVLVPRDAVVVEAAARDLPVAVLASGSAPARAYVRVAELLMNRIGGDVAARDAARAWLDQWNPATPAATPVAPAVPAPPAARAPSPGWTGDDVLPDGDAEAPPRSLRPVAALLWLVVGAILGAALTVLLLLGPSLPLPV